MVETKNLKINFVKDIQLSYLNARVKFCQSQQKKSNSSLKIKVSVTFENNPYQVLLLFFAN